MKALSKEQIEWLREFLQEKWDFNETTGKVDITGYVRIYGKNIKEIPHKIEFGVCKGDFQWSGGDLESLRGFPVEVTGDFYINNHYIKSLEYCPKKIGGSFSCSQNQLETLENGPEEVRDNYDCSRNKLKSLEGCPEKVSRFNCSGNHELKSLKGGPQDVYSYDCSNCDLTSLDGIAQSIKSQVDVSGNKLWTLEGLSPDYRGSVSARKNYYPEAMMKKMLSDANKYGSWIAAYLVLLTDTKHQRMSKDERDKLRAKLTKDYISDNAIGLSKIWKDPIMDNPAIKRLFKKTEAGKEEEFVRSADLGADLSDLGF